MSLAAPAAVRRALSVLTPALLLAGGLAACTKDPDPSTLPDGATLVSESAAAMADLQTVHMEAELDPPLGTDPVSLAHVDIDLTAKGESAGEVQIDQGGLRVGIEMVVIADGTSFLKFPGTNWAENNLLAEFYDTKAILDPDRGIAKLLDTATDARTEGSERAGGKDCWKIAVTLDNDVVELLVPADLPGDGLVGTLWVDKDTKRLTKAVVLAPKTDSSPEATITFTITAFNEPVDIRDPLS